MGSGQAENTALATEQQHVTVMTDYPISDAALKVAPLLQRNENNIVTASYQVENARQSVTLWVQAFQLENDLQDGIMGLVNAEEYIKLTVPLTGPVKPLIEEWLKLHLPGFVLADWQTWQEPVCCSKNEWF